MDADKIDRTGWTPRAIDDRMVCPICHTKWYPKYMRWQLNGRAVCVLCSDKIERRTLGLR